MKKTIYLSILLSFFSTLNSCKKNEGEKTITKQSDEYESYILGNEKSIANLDNDRKLQRVKWLTSIKANPVYIALVDSTIVSQEYLPVLTCISNAIKNTTKENGESIFSIDEALASEIENSKNGKDKMDFIIPVSCLAIKSNGGLPSELVDVFERYRKKYGLYGLKGDTKVNVKGDQEEITTNYNISYAFALFNPEEHKALDAIYESIQNGLGNWNDEGSNYENLYMATRSGYMSHLKEYYKKSSYLINADFEITPKELYAAYEANEVAADEKYKGKTIAITGSISDIKKDILDHPYVSFHTDYLKSVTCYFPDDSSKDIAELEKDQKITIIGKCRGLSLMNVVIKDCKIAP